MTKRTATHYSNLRVAENAPPEVIKAAYRALAQQYHPDKNPSPDAPQIMRILNDARDTLTDPVKKSTYDAMLAEMRRPPGSPPPKLRTNILSANISSIIKKVGLAVLVIVVLKTWLTTPATPSSTSQKKWTAPLYDLAPSSASRPAYTRPLLDPLGYYWPTVPAYLSHYPVLHNDGLCQVTVDNTQNDSDVFVKLMAVSHTNLTPVRHIFIPARRSFTCTSITPGDYDVRYRDLDSGVISKTDSFTLDQIPTPTGTSYSVLSLTLYKVRDGNMDTKVIGEAEF